VLEVDADAMCRAGHTFYRSENGVYLVDEGRPDPVSGPCCLVRTAGARPRSATCPVELDVHVVRRVGGVLPGDPRIGSYLAERLSRVR
jgi:hypothetical protein